MTGVDRGGLDYKISVADQFSAATRKFREELLLSRRAFQAFKTDVANLGRAQTELARASIASSRARVQATREAARAAQDEVRAAQPAIKAAQNQARFFAEQNRIRAQSAREARAVETKAARDAARETASAQRTAQKTSEANLKQQISQQQQIERLRANILKAQQRDAREREAQAAKDLRQARVREQQIARESRAREVAAKRAEAEQKRLRREILGTETAASRAVFTFRRLFGVLAAFTLAREGLSAFGNLVSGGVSFNNTIQESIAGFGGLISALADVRNAQGELLSGSEAFNASLGLSRDFVKAIRQDALRTVATFEELLEVNQVALGPGLAEGLNLDQVRQLALQVSQAAAALRVPQNQLSEEIRALLTGSITDRTSRIATALRVRPEDVRNAQRTGKLFDFLTGRLENFGKSAELQAQGLAGTFARLRGVIGEVSGAAAEGLSGTLTNALQGLIDKMTTVDVAGNLIPDPKAVAVFETIFGAIDRLTKRAADFISTLDMERDVLPAIQGVVQAAEGLLDIILAVGRGIANAIIPTMRTLGPIIASLATTFAPFLSLLTQARVALLFLELPFKAIRSTVMALAFAGRDLLKIFGVPGLGGTLTNTAKVARTLGVGLAGAAVAAIPLVSSIFEVETGFQDAVTIVGIGLVGGIRRAAAETQILALRLKEALGLDTRDFLDATAQVITRFVGGAAQQFASFIGDNATAESLGRALEQLALDDDKLRGDLGIQRVEEERKRREQIEKDLAAQMEADAKRIGEILAGGTTGAGFDARLAELKRIAESAAKTANTIATGGADGATATPRDPQVTEKQREELAIQTEKNRLKAIEVNLDRELAAFGLEAQQSDATKLAATRAQIAAAESQLLIQGEIANRKLDEANRLVDAARGEEQRNFEIERRKQLLIAEGQTLDELRTKLARMRQEEEQRRKMAEGTVTDGLSQGLADFAQEFGSAFKAGINIARGAMTQFASFISSSVVDAFDPTQEFDLKERFARFLQDIARLIIQELAQLAIARAILGLSPASGAAGAAGLAKGGSVPSFQGYAEGGSIKPLPGAAHFGVKAARPSGLDPRDTTPIWAQPGEFMHPVRAVRAYGADFMEAIRNVSIDPTVARGLMGLKKMRRVRSAGRRGPGYATGGSIQAARAAAENIPTASSTAGSQAPAPTYLVADEQTAGKLFAGGRNAFLDFARQNKGAINAALR